MVKIDRGLPLRILALHMLEALEWQHGLSGLARWTDQAIYFVSEISEIP